MLLLTSASCWLLYVKETCSMQIISHFYTYFSWLCFYLHQWKPLFGPQLSSANARALRILWGTEL